MWATLTWQILVKSWGCLAQPVPPGPSPGELPDPARTHVGQAGPGVLAVCLSVLGGHLGRVALPALKSRK